MEKILLNNLDVKYFESFLSLNLENTYIQKIQSLSSDELGLKMKIKSKEKNLDLIVTNGFLFITKYNYSTAEKNPFVKKLNELLKNEKIISITQKDFERIIVFETAENYLIFELFSHNNIILTNKDYDIIGCTVKEKWADREIKINKKYLFPSSTKENPKTLSGNYQTVGKLLTKLNIPPSLVEHIYSLNNNLATTEREIKTIYSSEVLFDKVSLIKTKKLEYYPFDIKGAGKIDIGFNEILDNYFHNPDNFKKEIKPNKKTLELSLTIKKVDDKLKEFDNKIQESNDSAKWIEENYSDLEEIREAVVKGLSIGKDPKEIIELLKKQKNKYPVLGYISSLDLKNKKIIFFIPQDLQQVASHQL